MGHLQPRCKLLFCSYYLAWLALWLAHLCRGRKDSSSWPAIIALTMDAVQGLMVLERVWTQVITSVTSIKGICSSSIAGKEDCCHCMKRLGNSSQTTPSEPSGPFTTRPTPTGSTRPEEPT